MYLNIKDYQTIWRLAHNWAGHDSDSSDPNNLPQEVREAIYRIMVAIRNRLITARSDFRLILQDEDFFGMLFEWQHYKRFNACLKHNRFDKYYLDSLYVWRPEVLRWCANDHLHIATYSKHKMPLEVMRRIWWNICGGRGMGNVDVRYIRQQGHHGTAKIAQYLSKYISKGFDSIERFNKKRYWVSDHDLPEAQRTWLRSRTIDGAIREIYDRAAGAIDFGHDSGGFFIFPDQSGFWFAVHPGQGSPPPF